MEGTCPLCGLAMDINPRYPRAVCGGCATKAMDGNGRVVLFSNTALTGGVCGQYVDTHQLYTLESCFIDGHACQAVKAHLGGIVILLVEENNL